MTQYDSSLTAEEAVRRCFAGVIDNTERHALVGERWSSEIDPAMLASAFKQLNRSRARVTLVKFQEISGDETDFRLQFTHQRHAFYRNYLAAELTLALRTTCPGGMIVSRNFRWTLFQNRFHRQPQPKENQEHTPVDRHLDKVSTGKYNWRSNGFSAI